MDRIRDVQASAKAARDTADAERAEATRAAIEWQAAADKAGAMAWQREILGEELADMEVTTAADAKIAIKLARMRKTEYAATKRELAAELADIREEWRDRTAGRYSTVGLGRGTSGRIMRSAVQSKRRSERQSHAEVVNEFSDRKQELDQALASLDRVIVSMQRIVHAEGASAPTSRADTVQPPIDRAQPSTGNDPTAVLRNLADMRDQGLITPDEYDAKKAEVLARI